MRAWVGVVMLVALGCGSKKSKPRATRDDCLQVADHTADMLVEYLVAHPDMFWDGVHNNPGDTGIPPDVTKETFPQFLASPDGKAWVEKRHVRTREGLRDEADIKKCTGVQTKKWVACMLASSKPEDGAACDASAPP